MISADEFVDILEKKDLVPEDLIGLLRQKIAESQIPSAIPPWNKPVTAARLAKWLVDNGHLSRLLAQRLLAQAEGPSQPSPAPPGRPVPKQPQAPPAARLPAEPPPEEELGLAPLEGEEPLPRPLAKKPAPAAPPSKPARPAKPAQPTKPPSRQPEPPVAQPIEGSLLDEELPVAGSAAAEAGPLDGLMEGTLLDSAAAAGPLDVALPEKRGLFGGRRRRRKKENIWDSTLLLVGGGTLLGLVIVGVVLIWAFGRRSADDMLQAANDFYQQGSYTNAILNYDRYLEKFPKHSGVSLARVRRGLSQLRQATDATSNWTGALDTATEVLDQIDGETAFAAEARPELAALLPKIAEGLAQKARENLDPVLVEQARAALALVDKYVPHSQQPHTRLQDVEALLALTERQIAQGEELNKATAAMLAAVEQGKTQEAYEIRNALLRQYPRLVDNEQLRQAVRAVSRAEQSAVKMISDETTGDTSEPPSAARSAVALARRHAGKPVSGANGLVLGVLAEGAAYALEAATGKVLWRREVGFPINPSGPAFVPLPVDDKPGSDFLLVDTSRNEVLRVEAATGRLRWRHAIGEPFDAHPAIADDRLLVATRGGRIVWIDLETGSSPGYLQLRQGLTVAPAVDLRRSKIYQLAEHSNLFVLSLSDGEALQTVYLGHEQGNITTPPVIVSRYLILSENDRAEGCRLRVLSLEGADEASPVAPLQEVPVNGLVDTPPLVLGTRVLVVTDKGDIYVFEISASNAEAPLVELAKGKAAEGGLGLPGTPDFQLMSIRYPLMVGSQIWVADSQLSRFDLQPSKARVEPRGIENEGSVTIQPPVPAGNSVVHVRYKIGLPGVIVSAMPMEGGRALWETHLAAPLVTEPSVDQATGKISAVSAVGAVYQLDLAAVEGRPVVDEPAVALPPIEVRRPVTEIVSLEGGLLVLAIPDGPTQMPVVDPQQPGAFRWLTLPAPLGCLPVGFSGGLLAPCKSGQVVLLEPGSGRQQMEPFQPRLESGVEFRWESAASTSSGEAILADNRNRLYRIGVKQEPAPHLAQLAAVDLAEPIVSPLAVLDSVVYAVDAANTLLAFELPGLTRGQMLPLGGRCVWGPQRVGDRVLVATDDDRLWCLGADQKLLWKIDLPYGPLAGTPLAVDGEYLLAAAAGVLWRIDAATGESAAKLETGCPLATGPVLLGERLLVGGYDGTLYEFEKP